MDAYNDITPRVGVAYDVFGNGKTALKFNWGKYLAYAANDSPYTSTNPGATIVRNVMNRGWTDSNGDFVVDCDLLNPRSERRVRGPRGNSRQFRQAGCGDERRSGRAERLGRASRRHQFTFTVQQQVAPRVSAEFSFTHRTFNGFFVTDDLTRRSGDMSSYYETLHADGAAGSAAGRWWWLPGYSVHPDRGGERGAAQRILIRRSDLGAEREARGTVSISPSTPASATASTDAGRHAARAAARSTPATSTPTTTT